VIVYFGQIFLITEVAQIFDYFFHGKIDVSIVAKNWLGIFVLVKFLTDLSGHPGHAQKTKDEKVF
jgi:hypothetical protein